MSAAPHASRPPARHLAVLGSTGSIGRSTLDVAARHPDRFRVVALAAARDVETMLEQCTLFRPRVVAMADEAAAVALDDHLRRAGIATEVLGGADALCTVATLPEVDTVMAAIVGGAGLAPTLAAVRAGRRVLLANKESLVMAGALFMEAVTRHDALLLPIDSEHNALFQALPAGYDGDPVRAGVRRLLLTASGGPFRTRAPGELAHVTPDEACAHPRWVMGRKISVDSATMMNKGLEVIEAHWLFGVPRTAIEVVIHPQSVIHSLVEYVDGSVLAQLGNPDMRTPIAHALAWPERVDAGVVPLDLFKIARLDFEVPDLRRFPCLRIAFDALAVGGAAPVVLNAANECAVAAFLDGRLRYDRIAVAIDTVLAASSAAAPTSLDDVFAIDAQARVAADRWIDADASRIAPVAAIDAPTRPAPHR